MTLIPLFYCTQRVCLTSDNEIDAQPLEQTCSVVVTDAEKVHEQHDDGHQEAYVAQCVEKLSGNHKC
jgi:hypothetical protein